MFKNHYKKNQKFYSGIEGLLIDNPILSRGLVLAPAIVAATNAKNALVLGLLFAIITYFTVFLSWFVSRKLPFTIRIVMYTIISSLIYIPTVKFIDGIFPDTILALGVFVPLTIVNSLIVVKSETRFSSLSSLSLFVDLVSHIVGYFLAIMLIGTVREYLSMGTFYFRPLSFALPFKISAFVYPFTGFIIVAFLSAIIQRIKNNLDIKDFNTSQEVISNTDDIINIDNDNLNIDDIINDTTNN